MEIVRELLKQIPKLFKYLVPGLLFVVLCSLSFAPDSQPLLLKMIHHNIYLSLVLGGIGIYCIHRVIFWVIEESILKQYGLNCRTFCKAVYEKAGQAALPLECRDYCCSIIHTCLIMAELTFVFGLLAADGSAIDEYAEAVIACSVVLFVVSAGLYFYLGKLELESLNLVDTAAKPKKKTSKPAASKES